MGISVVGATPQASIYKGETQVDLGAASVETKQTVLKLLTNGTSMAISPRIARQNCYPIRLPWFEL